MTDMTMTLIREWQHLSHNGSQSSGECHLNISGISNVEQPPMVDTRQWQIAVISIDLCMDVDFFNFD